MRKMYPIPEAIQRNEFDDAYEINDTQINDRSLDTSFDRTSISKGKMQVNLDDTCFNCGNDHGRANRLLEVGRVAFTPATWRRKVGRKEGSAPATIIAACEDARINTRLVQSGKEPTPMMFCTYKGQHYNLLVNVFRGDDIQSVEFLSAVCAIISSYNSDDLPEFRKAVKDLIKRLNTIGDTIALIKVNMFSALMEDIISTIDKHMNKPNPEFKDSLNLGNELMQMSDNIKTAAINAIGDEKKRVDEMKQALANEARQKTMDALMARIAADASELADQRINDAIEAAKLADKIAKKAEDRADKEGAVDFQAIIDAENARKQAMKEQEKSERMLAEKEKLQEKIENKLKKDESLQDVIREAEKKAIEKLAKEEFERRQKNEKLKKKTRGDKKRPLEVSEYLRKRRAEQTAKITKRNGMGDWGDMNIIELPMTAHAATGFDKRITVRDEGPIPTRFDRWSVDKRIFPRKVKAKGAVVLVDISGSMRWTNDHLTQVLKLFPAATVAIYSGRYSDGNLVIVAKNGKRAEMDETYKYQLGANIIDGMALEWLAEQDSEIKIWMSDGGVSGRYQRWLKATALEKLSKFVYRNKIMQVNDAAKVIDVLNGKSPFRPTRRIMLPNWYSHSN